MNTDRYRFRVWDKVNKRYLPTCDIAIDSVFRGYLWDRDHDEWVWYSNDLLIEQCTGLRDKNGKLIYEGDRVESHDMFDDLYVFNVEWFQGKMVLRSTPNSAPVLVGNSLSYEIIGNIHEEKGAK